MRRAAGGCLFAVGAGAFGVAAFASWRSAARSAGIDDNLARGAAQFGYLGTAVAAALAFAMAALLVWQLRASTPSSGPGLRCYAGTICWLLGFLPLWSFPTDERPRSTGSALLGAASLCWLGGGVLALLVSVHLLHRWVEFDSDASEARALPRADLLWVPPATMFVAAAVLFLIDSSRVR